MTRRSLLASLMALSLLCGGLGVASASLEVVDQSGTAGTVTIYTKDEVDKALDTKGAATDVETNKAAIADLKNAVGAAGSGLTKEVADQKAAITANTKSIDTNKAAIESLRDDKLGKDLANSTFATKDALNDLTTTVHNKVDESVVEAALDNKADKTYVDTKLADYAKSDDVYTKTAADGKFATSAALDTAKTDLEGKITTAKNELDGKITANTQKIGANETAITDLKDADVRLEGKINQNTNDITGLKDKDVELSGKIDNNKNLIDQNAANITQNKNDIAAIGGRLTTAEGNIQTNADAINALDTKVGTINNGNYLDGTKSVGENLNALDAQTKTNTDEIARVNQELVNTNNHFNTELGKTNTALNKEVQERVDADTKLTGRIDATDKRTAGIKRTDTGVEEDNQTVIEGKVHFDQNGNVSDVKDLSAETITTTGNAAIGGALGVTGATTLNGALTANGEATFKDKVTVEKDLAVNGKLNVGEISMKNVELDAATGNKHDSATSITADGISNIASIENGGTTTKSQFSHNEKGTFNSASKGDSTDWKEATSNVTADGVENIAKDSKGNNNTFTQTSTDTKNTLTDKEGNTSTTRQDSKGVYGYAKDKDGNKSYTKQEGNRIAESVIGQDGKETKSEMTSTDITNTAKDGTITNDANNIVNKASGNISNSSATMDTTVTGRATESYGELETEVKGNEKHTVKGDQTNEVDGKQINTIKNGQENIISGGQINNITGDQTTTVTGDISNKAENITNEANTKLTDKVGSNTRVLDHDGITDTVTDTASGSTSTFKQRIDAIMGNVKTADGESEVTQKGDEINSVVGKGKPGNSRVTQKKGSIEAVVTDGTSFNHSRDIANASAKTLTGYGKMNQMLDDLNSSTKTITNGTYTTSKVQTALDITNTAADGTITNNAKNIVNNASGDMTNTVGGKLTTTVTGATEENYNGGLTTKVTGEEKHTVTGKQTNTVEGGQENIISGGQTNTITGGQVNNITGNQTTTITGNKEETVTENVTEDYKKNLTTTVGGNEIHDVKGTKTETVEGRVIENFKNGQETNVTGDQTTNVSGTQTTTATDINRNASSGMIDTIDNDYGTNTETKVAGKTTTDVSIKGTGEEGKYIRGANESRDYLIKGTLKNSETKTAEATSTEITDGINKASTRQDAKNLAGSVTNGTETGVSGIHANDDGSVSIDSSVVGGGMSSVINQKKDSIQSAVGDGTNSTVIRQDKDNVTIASSNGMVGLVGKDIVNNAKDTITNTAGTKITDTAGDSTITTENGKGTTFTKTGSTAYREGGPMDTNISSNTITTGKVTMDYADVMKDLGVRGNAKIDGKTTTGSLEVTGTSTLKGDVTMGSNATVNGNFNVEGNTNLKNTKVDGTLKVTKMATFDDSVSIANDLSVGGDVTAKSYKVGDKTYIDANGIHANGQKITDVADGSISEGSKDAVNGGQLYTVKNDLEGKVNKVGANAAAMANLHPMEFDPDSKWNIAAAIGNYGSETAAALGAFYRPNDDVMVNLSTAFGTGENMVGGGVSVRLGKGGNKLSREESNALKAQVADLTARMDALLSVLNPNMSKDFPDVPENHWAYEAVSRLAGNDIVQGYPDGEFHGERTMTRYEMAEIIYNALSRGAEAEKELVEEFKPELQAMAASEKATAEKAEG